MTSSSVRYQSLFQDQEYEKLINICKDEIQSGKLSGELVYWMSNSFYRLHDYETAIKIAQSYLDTLDNDAWKGRVLKVIGNSYLSIGQYRKSYAIYNEAETFLDRYGNIGDKAGIFNNYGVLHDLRGEIDKSLEFYRMSLDLKYQLDEKDYPSKAMKIANSEINVGIAYRQKKKYDKATKMFQKAQKRFQSAQNDIGQYKALFEMTRTKIDENKLDEAEEWFNRISDLYDITPSFPGKHMYLLAKGLYLKNSNSISDKSQAMDAFEQIISDKQYDAELTILAVMNFIEIKLEEYKIIENEEIIEEVLSLLLTSTKLAHENQLFPIILDIYLLQAQLYALQNEFSEAGKYFDRALEFINENQLDHLKAKYLSRKKQYEKNLSKMKHNYEKNKKLIEKLQQSDLVDYLESIKNLI